MVGKGSLRLEECVKVSRACQGRPRKKRMVGFVQMERGKLMKKMQKLG